MQPVKPPPAAVIFDWGGVFSHRPPGATRRALERRLGLEPGQLGAFFREEDWLLHSTGRQSEEEFRRRIDAGFPVPPDHDLSDRVWRHLFDNARRATVLSVLAQLQGRVLLGLLSNAGPALRPAITPLLSFFDDVVISAEVGCRKPDPEIFQLALARLGVQAEDTLLIDDFAHNIAAARELGFRAHRFRSPGRLISALAGQGLPVDNGGFAMHLSEPTPR